MWQLQYSQATPMSATVRHNHPTINSNLIPCESNQRPKTIANMSRAQIWIEAIHATSGRVKSAS